MSTPIGIGSALEYGVLSERIVLSLPTGPIMTHESHHPTIQFNTGVLCRWSNCYGKREEGGG